MIDEAFGRRYISKYSVLAIAASQNDLRMLVQQAAFTIHRDGYDLRVLTPEPILQQFIIPKTQRDSSGIAFEK